MQLSSAQVLGLLVLTWARYCVGAADESRAMVLPGRILRAHTLEMEVEYLRLYENMSMKYPGGKGEGKDDHDKGDKKVSKKCPPGKQKDGKGKGKGRDREKGKGRGYEKDKGLDESEEECAETISPSPSIATAPSHVPPTFAPMGNVTNVTTAPIPDTNITNTTAPTRAPVTGNVSSDPDVNLSPFYVFYTIEQTRIPTTDDIMTLGTFTASYVNTFLGEAFATTNEVIFVSANTETIGSQFRLGEPVRVDYRATVSFLPTSPMIPAMAELDEILRSVFEGANGATHVEAIQADLDPANIFTTTSNVAYEKAPTVTNRSGLGPIGISIMAVSALLFLASAGAVWYGQNGYSPVGLFKTHQDNGTASDETLVSDDHTVDSHSSHTPSTYRIGEESPETSRSEWITFSDDTSTPSATTSHYPSIPREDDQHSVSVESIDVFASRAVPNITDMLSARRSFLVSARK